MRIITSVINGMRPQLPKDCPSVLHDLITDCWQHKPSLRPTIAAIVDRLEAALAVSLGVTLHSAEQKGQIQASPHSQDRGILLRSPHSM